MIASYSQAVMWKLIQWALDWSRQSSGSAERIWGPAVGSCLTSFVTRDLT